jgi:hypothetical protein
MLIVRSHDRLYGRENDDSSEPVPEQKDADKDAALRLDCFVNIKQAMIYFGKQDGKGRW